MRCGLPLGRFIFLRYSASASLAGVSGCSLMRWPSQNIEASSLYSGAPLFSFGFGVQFNVVDFLRPVYVEHFPEMSPLESVDCILGPFKCYVTLFFWKLDPHPPPRNANNIEHYTFVTLFSRK